MNEVMEYQDFEKGQMVYELRIGLSYIASKKTLKWWKVEVTWMLIKMLWNLMKNPKNPSLVKVERKAGEEECK